MFHQRTQSSYKEGLSIPVLPLVIFNTPGLLVENDRQSNELIDTYASTKIEILVVLLIILRLPVIPVSVSYTHLDVYKRQLYALLAN